MVCFHALRDALRYAIYSFVTASDVRKPAQIRIAEATKNLDPTSAYLLRRRIIVDALQEEEEVPSRYTRNGSRLLRQMRNRRRL